MNEAYFHLAQPWWLAGLILIPIAYFWLKHSRIEQEIGQEARYADAHLLPYLIGKIDSRRQRRFSLFWWWSLAWSLLLLAMAEPRYDVEYRAAFQPAAEMVILLDLSLSMDIQDVRPSRLERAKQEIQDLIQLNPGIRIGLVGFATVAHVVSPITEDMELLRRVLPALSTELVYLKGSRLINALDKASLLLNSNEAEVSKHILLLSDGDFNDEPSALRRKIEALRREDIFIHVLGVGTEGGGPVPYQNSFSRLNRLELEQITKQGGGLFELAHYQDSDVQAVLDFILKEAGHIEQDIPAWTWKEYYQWPLLLASLIIAYLFGHRRYARGMQ